MGKPAARMGDQTAHGGVITKGEPTVMIGGMPAARVGDMHTCPMQTPGTPPIPHVGGPITLGSPTVMIANMMAARVGDMCTCTGPPDSIVMGCNTVLIGEGSAGGAGAGQTGGGGKETSTAKAADETEQHYIDVSFVDKGGKPISGVQYTLKDPDANEVRGTLAGKVKRSGLKEGNCEIALKAIIRTEWSVKEARVGETVKLKAEVCGFDSATKAIFQIFEKDFNSADDLIATVEGQTQGNTVEVDWEYQYVEDTDDVQTEQDERLGYSLPEYYFTVQIDGVMARSPLLYFKDYVEITLKDRNNNPVPGARFRLYFANGQIVEGTLDSNGYKRVENVPPGEWSVSFPGAGPVTRPST